jgi:hypothetical protein
MNGPIGWLDIAVRPGGIIHGHIACSQSPWILNSPQSVLLDFDYPTLHCVVGATV